MMDKQEMPEVPEWIKPYGPLLGAIHFATEKYGEAEVLKVIAESEVKRHHARICQCIAPLPSISRQAADAGCIQAGELTISSSNPYYIPSISRQ